VKHKKRFPTLDGAPNITEVASLNQLHMPNW